MARLLSLMVGITFVVVLLSAIHGVDSNCANHCRERCKQINIRQRSPRLPCYIRCRKLAATCKSCSGPRWCFKCLPGYLLTTEPRCVVNKCRINNGGCDTDATCSNSMNRFGGISFTCECNSGFNGDGTSCTDVDECETNNGGCSDNGDTNAICSNNIGSFMCSCSDGFTQKGTSCIDQNECLVNRGGCRDNGDTKAVCINNRGNFTCKCSAGFTSAGTSCNDKDECVTNNGGCRDNGDINAVCVNNLGSFTCNCSTGFAFNSTGCIDINECLTNNGGCRDNGDINAVCVNNPGSFTCNCSTGFASNGTSCNRPPIKLTYTISLTSAVTALASNSYNLYVAVYGSNDIAVYNATTFEFQRKITISQGLKVYYDMVVSTKNDYLYVASFNQNLVYKLTLPSGTPSSWNVDQGPWGIAINRHDNLLVTGLSKKIVEYTPAGNSVSTIAADPNYLTDVVELSNGKWAITRVGPTCHGIAVISSDGSVQYSYGNATKGTAPGVMVFPYAVTVGNQDYLLVSDKDGNRLLLFDPTLSARTLSLPVSPAINKPSSIWLDESRGILIVGEQFTPNRVLVFSNVYSLASAFATA